jgi:hypothetical protein
MQIAIVAVATALAAAVSVVTPLHGHASPTPSSCGVELWSLKTLSDPQRNLVNLHPRNTSVRAINRLPMPHPTPRTRNTVYERRAWRVKAQVVQFNWRTTRTST